MISFAKRYAIALRRYIDAMGFPNAVLLATTLSPLSPYMECEGNGRVKAWQR